MKKGKEGKIGQPMFPRVHVSDTDKGGPKAPPRNKMALYEQLSIPSQRFNSSSLMSQALSAESHKIGRGLNCVGRQPQSMAGHFSNKLPLPAASSDRGTPNSYQYQLKKQQILLPQDGCAVPVFVQSDSDPNHNNMTNCSHEGRILPVCDPNVTRALTRNSVVSSSGLPSHEETSFSNVKPDLRNITPDKCAGSLSKSEIIEVPLKQNTKSGFLSSPTRKNISSKRQMADFTTERSSHDSELRLPLTSLNQAEIASFSPKNFDFVKKMGSECNEISETSTMDSASVFDPTPDDVAKLIGSKRFWKARKMIADQQRVFATQLFELHRLVQAQQMIARYPDILLEDGINESCKTISTLEESVNEPSKAKLPEEKPSSHQASKPWLKPKPNSESYKPNEVNKPSSSNKTMVPTPDDETSQHDHPFPPANPHDTNMNPWAFHHPIGHQWLVPVMSPSEGLVYKPYPAPGFMGSVCGGCGNHGAPPLANQTMYQPSFQAPHNHLQQFGMLQCTPYPNFPMFSVPSMSGSRHGGTMTQVASNGRQSSELSTRKSSTALQSAKKLQVHDSQLLGSTATSGCEKENTSERDKTGRQQNQLTKVIKVVPRNRRSATESAARIFQSIQEERKRHAM